MSLRGDGYFVLVCGSRAGPRGDVMQARLAQLPRGTRIMHGGARGADRMAGVIAARLGFHVIEVPAIWRPKGVYNPRAGLERNIAMLDEKPDLVIAFHLDNSTGTQHVIDQCVVRGIPLDVVSA